MHMHTEMSLAITQSHQNYIYTENESNITRKQYAVHQHQKKSCNYLHYTT